MLVTDAHLGKISDPMTATDGYPAAVTWSVSSGTSISSEIDSVAYATWAPVWTWTSSRIHPDGETLISALSVWTPVGGPPADLSSRT